MTEQNFFNNNQDKNSPFLLHEQKNSFSSIKFPTIKPKTQTKTINDFDSSIILEKINKTITNKAVKLGMKISTLQRELKLLNEKIELLELLNLEADKKKLAALKQVKENIENSLMVLVEEQKRKGLFYYLYSFFDEKFNISKLFVYVNKFITPYIVKFQNYAMKSIIKLFDYVRTNIKKQQL